MKIDWVLKRGTSTMLTSHKLDLVGFLRGDEMIILIHGSFAQSHFHQLPLELLKDEHFIIYHTFLHNFIICYITTTFHCY
jgi:hypothetical protein